MKLLLDTHILIWWSAGSSRLGNKARSSIMAADAELFVSAASWWELAIKLRAGRIDVDLVKMRAALEHREVQELAVTFAHAEAAASLPLLHGDPFDRMMVAQAALEKLTLMTRDKELARYGSMVLAV